MKRLVSTVSLLAAAAASLAAHAALDVKTRPVVEGRWRGPWQVSVLDGGDREYSIFDSSGRLVAGPFALSEFPVPDPVLWSDENPVVYTLSAASHDGRDAEEKVFGFAEMVAAEGRFFVNGRPVRVKLGPKEVRGNALESSEISVKDAWESGVYRLTKEDLSLDGVERPHENADATRHRFQNWSVRGTNYNQRIVVENRNSFTDAGGLELEWTLLVDGKKKDSGRIDLMRLEPLSSAVFDMPAEATSARYAAGSASVRFAVRRPGGLFSRGEILAEDQVDLSASRETDSFAPETSWVREWLVPGFMKPKVSVENDGAWRVFKAGGLVSKFGTSGKHAVAVLAKDGFFGEREMARLLLPGPAEISSVSSSGGSVSFAFGEARWTILPSGTVAVESAPETVRIVASPRTGGIEWFGLGPRCTTPGDAEGAFLGLWKSAVPRADDPGGSFSATLVSGFKTDDFAVRTLGAPFSVSAKIASAKTEDFDFAEFEVSSPGGLALTVSADEKELSARSP